MCKLINFEQISEKAYYKFMVFILNKSERFKEIVWQFKNPNSNRMRRFVLIQACYSPACYLRSENKIMIWVKTRNRHQPEMYLTLY